MKTPPKSVSPKKFLTPLEAFGNAPVKQDTVEAKIEPESDLGIHNDDDFEKTLLDLDENELLSKVDNGNESAEAACKDTKEAACKDTKEAACKDTKYENKTKKESPVKSKTPTRKRKNSSGNEDVGNANTDEERHERKRHSAMLYQKYLNRSGPIHLGSKWLPKVIFIYCCY